MGRPSSPLDVRLGKAPELILELVHELRRRLLDHVHSEVLPQLMLHGVQPGILDSPRSGVDLLLAPDALQEHAQRPIAHAIAEEEEMTVADLVEDLQRY